MRFRFLSCRPVYLLAFLFLFWTAGPASHAQQRSRRPADFNPHLKRMTIPGTVDLRLIVELSEPALLERIKTLPPSRTETAEKISERRRRLNFGTAQAALFRQQIGRSQESMRRRILGFPGIEVLGTTNALMNTIVIRTPAANYTSIRQLPGIKKIYFSRPRKALLDSAAAVQNASELWTMAGGQTNTGRGVKIGIIDSGIDITSPMFSDAGFSAPSGFPKYDAADMALTNSKVIVARHFISQSAVDEIGHGTFVAGCAAGNLVAAPRASISGMAPGAYLGNYKILDSAGSTNSDAIIRALDTAVADGMDVVNLSIGSLDYLPPEENAEYVALENAVKAGVVVTVAAGNEGSETHTITNPGSIPDVITVGSVTGARNFLAALHTRSPNLATVGYLPSADGIRVTQPIEYTKIVDVASMDQDGLGCSAFSGSMAGAIALIKRGTCTFAVKVGNAQMAGAKAVVVYNNVPVGLDAMADLGSASIPAVMISMADGTALKQYIGANPETAQAAIDDSNTIYPVPATARVVSPFSSVGPGTDFSIKPDLVAVGESVYSATERTIYYGSMYDASGYTVNQGTSFSSPMVAGAAASLIQRFPSLGAPAIKSLLTTTATGNVTVDGTNQAGVLSSGSGLLNMGNAWAATAVFSPASLNFGVRSYAGNLSLSKSLTIENLSSNSDQFTLEYEPIVAGPAITFSKTSTGIVAAGASVEVQVNLDAVAPQTGGFQGFINVRSSSSSFVYRIPYWAGLYVPDSTRVLQVTTDSAVPGSYSALADAIAAAQPGNIIEIADGGTYSAGSSGLRISTNSQGLPLHGLTIRAAQGRTPVIEGKSGAAGISVIGVQNLLLQELTIKGGYTGIDILQPSASFPLSVTIDSCDITGSNGDSGATGIWIDGGGSVEITRSIIENSSGTGLISGSFIGGTQLTITGSTFRGNAFDGLELYDTNAYIANSVFSANTGAGLYLENCTGAVEGNTIAQNRTNYFRGYYGDGLQISDGNLTVRNNLLESNDEVGVALFSSAGASGPAVRIVGNTIRRSGSYGIHSSPSRSMIAEGNLIEDNAGGSLIDATTDALLVNNIIVRSTGSDYGTGVKIDNGSGVRIVNNTIYRNNLYGVSLTSGTVSIANSIVVSNAMGELQGVEAGSVRSSLTSGDPEFADAASDNFSPVQGSAAIDAGSNAEVDLPFLDYYGRLRVASATDLPGKGTVDIGAIESSSAYPLVYPLIVNGRDSTLGSAFATGVAFANPDNSPMQLNFTAYQATGFNLAGNKNPAAVSLDTEAQLAILDFELFGYDITTAAVGSVLGSSDKKPVGFFLILDSDFRRFSTGANASTDLSNELIFMRHLSSADRATTYTIFNPGVNTANITATLYGADGAAVGLPKTEAIAPKGRIILRFDPGADSGYIRVSSDRPVSGVELVGNESIMAALGGLSPDSQARLFFPHFAVGGHYSTQVGIVNTSSSTANLTVDAYDDQANFIGSMRSITLPAGGQLMKTVSELFNIPVEGPLRTGYLIARSDQPGIMGFTDYGYNDGQRISDATIPADPVPSRRLLFSHIAHGVNAGNGRPYQTGIALLNPFGTAVEYKISVFDGAGTLVAEAYQTIGPRQKIAKILTYPVEGVAFFSKDLVLGNGHIEVTTDYGLIGLELFFTEDLSQMASVPAQTRN